MSEGVRRIVEEEEEIEVERGGDGSWAGLRSGRGSGRVGGGVDGGEGWEEDGWFWKGEGGEDGLNAEEDWGDGYGETSCEGGEG